jgi:hypothetical protein
MQAKAGPPAEAASAQQPSFMYEVAWQASAALPATAPSAESGAGLLYRQLHTAKAAGTSDSQHASIMQYGRTRPSDANAPAGMQQWQGGVTWLPAAIVAAGGRKQRHGLPHPACVGDPAAVTQGLELLQRVLAAAPAAGSSIALQTQGGLPAARSSCDIAGSAPAGSAAASAWGLARVAALEYADCRWHSADMSDYSQHAPQVTRSCILI